ncbi:metallophosphoesterase N-terminal domain-containing protein, partial [Bacteroides caccae]
MKRLSVILVSFLLYLPLSAQFKGTVYVDTDQSGLFNKGDKPLAGVMVTDGLNVVKTDKKGRFSLPGFDKTRFISITTPAGFETEQFYLSTKENRKSYDFILTESERTKAREHSFVQITDTEVTGGMGRWVTDLQQYVKNEKPAFLIHTGDICYEPGLTMHNQIVNAQTMDCPVYYCIGNHDLVKGSYGEELYESLYGPTWYSFDMGNVHYVVTPIDHGDHPTNY